MTWLVYFGAGGSFAWLCTDDEWWQRYLTIFLWPLLMLWVFVVQSIDWWRGTAYAYEDTDDAAS